MNFRRHRFSVTDLKRKRYASHGSAEARNGPGAVALYPLQKNRATEGDKRVFGA